MSGIVFFFGIFFCLASFCSILVKNPVHAIISLVMVFFFAACYSLFLGTDFLALLFLIVYVGAIAVLFIFVVMLLNIKVIELNLSFLKYWWMGILLFLFLFFFTYSTAGRIVGSLSFADYVYINRSVEAFSSDSVAVLGEYLFIYRPTFLFLAVLLLFISVISPVVLTYLVFIDFHRVEYLNTLKFKLPGYEKRQNIFYQTLIV